MEEKQKGGKARKWKKKKRKKKISQCSPTLEGKRRIITLQSRSDLNIFKATVKTVEGAPT